MANAVSKTYRDQFQVKIAKILRSKDLSQISVREVLGQ